MLNAKFNVIMQKYLFDYLFLLHLEIIITKTLEESLSSMELLKENFNVFDGKKSNLTFSGNIFNLRICLIISF